MRAIGVIGGGAAAGLSDAERRRMRRRDARSVSALYQSSSRALPVQAQVCRFPAASPADGGIHVLPVGGVEGWLFPGAGLPDAGHVFQNLRVDGHKVQGIPTPELPPQRLVSPDDFSATRRGRRNTTYYGYAANLSETCDPGNAFQLITQVQLDSNNVDDPQFLLAALPQLKERGGLETLYTDGGFGSFEVDQAMQTHQVEQVPQASGDVHPTPSDFG